MNSLTPFHLLVMVSVTENGSGCAPFMGVVYWIMHVIYGTAGAHIRVKGFICSTFPWECQGNICSSITFPVELLTFDMEMEFRHVMD